MNTPDPQAMAAAWMSQFTNPASLQSWFKSVPQMGANPLADMLKEAGVGIDPEVLSKLESDYMRQCSELWQDVMMSKTPAISDKRFSGASWQSNAFYSFNAASYLLSARFLLEMADAVEAPAKTKQQIGLAVQ